MQKQPSLKLKTLHKQILGYLLLVFVFPILIEQHTFKNVNSCMNTNIYTYLETYGG